MPLLLLILWLIAEAWSIAWVGERVGGLAVFILLLLIAAAGSRLIQHQGFKTLSEVQAGLQREQLPALAMLDGLIVFLAGVLLVVPGFVSDVLALLLLFGGPRRRLAGLAETHLARRHPEYGRVTIEGEYEQVTEQEALERSKDCGRKGGPSA